MKIWILAATFIMCLNVNAQDDLLNSLDEQIGEEPVYTAYTFKSTHIINGHSIENMRKNQLDFRINHRFGQVNSGLYDLYGLDHAFINFSLDYGLTDWFMVGFRRGTEQKTYDASVKLLLYRQCTGVKNHPVSISYYSDFSANTEEKTLKFNSRLAYTQQILIARKFNDKLSLQLSPSFVHRNLVKDFEENDTYSIGFGGRYKFIRRIALTWETFYSPQLKSENGIYNPIAIGFDIETGGHVFQLFVSNSQAMVEKGVIAETKGDINHGGFYLGFNISRVFAFGSLEK